MLIASRSTTGATTTRTGARAAQGSAVLHEKAVCLGHGGHRASQPSASIRCFFTRHAYRSRRAAQHNPLAPARDCGAVGTPRRQWAAPRGKCDLPGSMFDTGVYGRYSARHADVTARASFVCPSPAHGRSRISCVGPSPRRRSWRPCHGLSAPIDPNHPLPTRPRGHPAHLGTNGVPKSAPLTHRNIGVNVNQHGSARRRRNVLLPTPLLPRLCLTFFLCASVRAATQVPLPKLTRRWLDAHKRRPITFFAGSSASCARPQDKYRLSPPSDAVVLGLRPHDHACR